MDLFQQLQLFTEDKLIEIFRKKQHKTIFPEYNIMFKLTDKSLTIILKEFTYIIFLKNIKAVINDKNQKISIDVRTNTALKNFFLQYNIDLNKIKVINEVTEEKFIICFNFIDFFIQDNDTLELKIINIKIPVFKFSEECISLNENLNPDNYSKFFYDYFPSIRRHEKDEVFEFNNNIKRKEIVLNFNKLMHDQSIKKYKIAGPLSTGKSMTLFRISLAFFDIIYINLKTLNKNCNNLYKCLEIIFSGCSRVFFQMSERQTFKQELEKIDFTQNILQILLKMINLIILTVNRNIYLILDQFKSDNIKDYNEFILSLEEMMKQKLKVIYCSSVNDKEMRDQLIETFIKFNGNPKSLSGETQEYYFYYEELYSPKKTKNLSYILFKDKYSYSKLLDENNLNDSLNNINNKIISKLKIFKDNSVRKEITNNNYNLSDILLLLKKIMYEKLEICQLINIISNCPFKYFIIEISSDNEYFMISPIFPYMIYFINNYVKYKDCDDFFLKGKYNIDSFLSNKVKGEYFKYSVKIGIKEKLALPEKINEEIFVDKIAEMNRITNDFDEFLLEIREKDNKEDKEEENDEEKMKTTIIRK